MYLLFHGKIKDFLANPVIKEYETQINTDVFKTDL